MRIFISDLTYNTNRVATEALPINIGFMASYCRKRFGSKVDIKLFKYHEDLEKAIEESPPDILGLSNYIWNQLVDVYNDWGKLDKGVVRVKRTGTGMYDTSYTLSATARPSEIPADKLEAISDLVDIKSYYKDRYGQVTSTAPSSEGVTLESSSDDFTDNLF